MNSFQSRRQPVRPDRFELLHRQLHQRLNAKARAADHADLLHRNVVPGAVSCSRPMFSSCSDTMIRDCDSLNNKASARIISWV